jgi:hypothetical protein
MFVNKFYSTLDTKRHVQLILLNKFFSFVIIRNLIKFKNIFFKELGKYYDDETKLVWCGNEIEPANRQKFQQELPDTTHNIESFDVHPIFSKKKLLLKLLLIFLLKVFYSN